MARFEKGWNRFLAHNDQAGLTGRLATAYAGENICVTGAGGDIGSALTKALRPDDLSSLVLLDSSEHGLFEMKRYMEAKHPGARCEYVLGSVEDGRLLAAVFNRFRPRVLFHAAGFKHVGLLEHNPFSAIRNNVLGTDTLIKAALDHGTSTFVLLSTDKAVNPHSVMGVSKRIAELLTVSRSRASFRASAIRLGNVIGSRGSVIPIFLEQIASGLPISVTHPEASRYFFSRVEAIDAIIAAGAAACDGMILLPPFLPAVSVADLARFLAGHYDPAGDMPIRFTGLRPGEKLIEDLVGDDEEQVGIVDGPLRVMNTRRLSLDQCDQVVAGLTRFLASGGEIVAELCRIVPEYVPSQLVRSSSVHLPPGQC